VDRHQERSVEQSPATGSLLRPRGLQAPRRCRHLFAHDRRARQVAPALVIEGRSSHERHPAHLVRLERATNGPKSSHYGNNVLLPHQAIFDLTVDGQCARLIPPNG
jgi:hypothetical protein